MKSILLRLDDQLAERLELMNRVLGGVGTKGSKKSAIMRCALENSLPDQQHLKEIIQYKRSSLQKQAEMDQPKETNFIREVKQWI